jgi:AbrB family looped-hinge helix DNA binding protein
MKSRVSGRGQTVIPKEVRKALGITPASVLMWNVKNGRAEVVALPADPVKSLRGILKDTGFSFDEFLKERNKDREYERKLEEGHIA